MISSSSLLLLLILSRIRLILIEKCLIFLKLLQIRLYLVSVKGRKGILPINPYAITQTCFFFFEKEIIFKMSRGFCETGSFVIRTSSSSSCPFHALELPSGRIDLIGLENRAKVNCAKATLRSRKSLGKGAVGKVQK